MTSHPIGKILVVRMQDKPRLLVVGLLALVLLSITVSLALGRDLNWDFLNYHFYGASLLVDGRLEQDYFAASLQSYLNPLSYVPQYLMIRAGWHSAWIGGILATVHAINLVFIALISRRVLPLPQNQSTAAILIATLLAMAAPLYLTTAGSSFSDATTSLLILAALWLMLTPLPRVPALGALAAAGLLFGFASGLKLTNVVLAVGLALPFAVLWSWQNWRAGTRAMLVLFGAGVAGLVAAHGYWSLQLWRAFGNPFFPLFNGVFGSPDFPTITFRDERFVGAGVTSLLTLPFEMVEPISWLYAENVAVDVRFAVLVVLVAIAVSGCVARKLLPTARLAPVREAGATDGPLGLYFLSAAFLFCYLLWGLTSKIGRYALPLWLLLGPLVVSWAALVLREPSRVRVFGALLVAVQATVLWMGGNPRWSPAYWSQDWLEVQAPPSLLNAPATLLTMGTQSYSFVAPFLHPEARVSNLVGQYVQPAGERMTPRLKALIKRDPLYVAFRDRRLTSPHSPELAEETRADVDAVLSIYGLRLASAVCERTSSACTCARSPPSTQPPTRLWRRPSKPSMSRSTA